MFHIATPEEIKTGRTTDVYFLRTQEVLEARGKDARVAVEVRASSLPRDWPWAIFAGLEEAVELLEGVPADVWALPEGSMFRAGEPVLILEGNYLDFGIHETALLGFFCHGSGVATMAARCKLAAGERTVLSFGARRIHPAITPMVDRAAYLGGLDGVSAVLSAERLGLEPMGTMPHAMILLFGDTVEGAKAFHDVMPPAVPRIVLIDTFNDERFEAIRVAEALGQNLCGVRCDTPDSRKGDFRKLFEEIRWELRLRGFEHVKLMASGGLNEWSILDLNPVCDGYGVGTAVSNAPVVDFSLDIVERGGVPYSKRGKLSGKKQVARCETCHNRQIVPWNNRVDRCPCGGPRSPLLAQVMGGGRPSAPLPGLSEIRARVLEQLAGLSLESSSS